MKMKMIEKAIMNILSKYELITYFAYDKIILSKDDFRFIILSNPFQKLTHHYMSIENFNLLLSIDFRNAVINDNELVIENDYKVYIPIGFANDFVFVGDFDKNETIFSLPLDKTLINRLNAIYDFYNDERNIKEILLLLNNGMLLAKLISRKYYETLMFVLQSDISSDNLAISFNPNYLDLLISLLPYSRKIYFAIGYLVLDFDFAIALFPVSIMKLNYNYIENFVNQLRKDISQKISIIDTKYQSLNIKNNSLIFEVSNHSKIEFSNDFNGSNLRCNISFLNIVKSIVDDELKKNVRLYQREDKLYFFDDSFFFILETKLKK